MNIKQMVDRFLGWKLPRDFSPDGGISFDDFGVDRYGMLIGTNLFSADQAQAMFEYCCGNEQPSRLQELQQQLADGYANDCIASLGSPLSDGYSNLQSSELFDKHSWDLSIEYLTLRNLIERHPGHPDWIRIKGPEA